MPGTRRVLTFLANGISVVVIAAGIFFALASSGIIARPAVQIFSVGG